MKKAVLITGVFGGIGYASAKLFKQEGWDVIGVDKQKRDDTENAVDLFIEKDISKSENINAIWTSVKVNYPGGLCGVVNNAGHQVAKGVLETTEEEWDTVLASNVKSVFLSAKHAYPLLKMNGGAIVNVSSVHAFATSKNISAYAASKGALLALTRVLSLEFADANIRVNCVIPGAVRTNMLISGLSRGHLGDAAVDVMIDKLGLRHPVKRVGEPEDIANLIYFLIDNNRAAFITGQSFCADGGALAQLSTEVE
ncbi:MAG: SDR family oxidoreductase [Clostridiales bacterium]|jgi:NAD(P)-dependent dehydrogenase (short-subunit alcohol dehydrogenase family)|nr:SDR family oxidoreductase [Clostridiales bacterium]